MAHLALYRKYRSQTFEDLVGQSHVVRTLQSGIEQGKFSHAYLFTGPRGTGKTSAARLLAKALNCEKGPTPVPCNTCDSCLAITAGNSLDVLEMDAASESGVDDVRDSIIEASEYQPAAARFRVFIIDEVHDLSAKAFDALLKTIEEPPAHVVFILATTEFAKVPGTVRSRCQRFEFHRGTIQDLTGRLQFVAHSEGVEAEPSALAMIARMADGGYRDALTLLEQALLTSDGSLTLAHVYDQLGLMSDEGADGILKAMAAVDPAAIATSLDEVYRLGRDPRAILESLLMRLADLTRAAHGVDSSGDSDAAIEAALRASAAELGPRKLLAFRSALAEAHRHIRDVSLPRLWLEAELTRIAMEHGTVRAVAKPVAAPQPQPAKESVQPRVAEAGPAEEPAVVETAQAMVTDPEDLDSLADAWRDVVRQLSELSATAKARLESSRLALVQNGVAIIEFDRVMDADWVSEKASVRQHVFEAWRKLVGDSPSLAFVGRGKTVIEQEIRVTAVELPAEGERLAELAQEVFGTSPQAPSKA